MTKTEPVKKEQTKQMSLEVLFSDVKNELNDSTSLEMSLYLLVLGIWGYLNQDCLMEYICLC